MNDPSSVLRSFLAELKRRRVYRVAVVYAAVAFVVWQAAEIVVPGLNLPNWVLTLVIVLTALGFPIAVVLAWAFDITPAGIERTEGEGLVEAVERPSPPRLSVAVLPFENLSADPENEYFSDGVSEELLNTLARAPDLRVAARTSSFAFKGKAASIGEIGEALNVAHVVEGSVRRVGDRVRITAQLIDVADGYHLWSEAFDRELGDILMVQREIAESIGVPERKIDAIRRAMKAVSSSNQAPTGADGEAADFAELCSDSRNGQPEVSVERREEFQMILQLLDSIDERDARVIKLRFGLEGQPPLTLKEIGREVGLTRERVRQIEMEALRRLQAQMMDDRPGRFVRPTADSASASASPVRMQRGHGSSSMAG